MGRTDSELIAASRAGDATAFGAIVERYQRAVCAVSYSGTGDRTLSEDIAQDTFVTAWRQLAALREIERLPAWLCGIARNLARSARRKRGRETSMDDRDIASDTTPFDAISDREAEAVVAAALARVPDTYREPLVLFYCEQQSVKAVAHALGITEDATHQRLSRGRQQLAANVTGLVERTLERRPRRDLAAAVVAAIGVLAIGSSRVDASTTSTTPKGTTMMKLGLAAALAVAIGGAGYVAATHSDAKDHAAPAAATAAISPIETSGRSPRPTTRAARARAAIATAMPAGAASAAEPLTCASVAQHIADLALESQPDAAQLTPEQGAKAVEPVLNHVQGACDGMHWSQEYLACVMAADSMFGVAVGCGKMTDESASLHDGFIKLHDSVAPIAPYTGTDLSCGSVARHLVQFSMPDPEGLANLPPEQRAHIAAGIARMHKTMPDQIDATCVQGSWTEAKRACMLAATTWDATQKCM